MKKPKRYKGYRLQAIECDKNGNRFEVECYMCEQIILVCHKYKKRCSSKVCLHERLEY